MPSAGWLAIGAVGAALGGLEVGLLVAGAIGAIGLGLGVAVGSRPTTMFGIGIVAVAVRLAVGFGPPVSTELPTGNGPWEATVVVLGSVREGSQVATIQVAVDGLPPERGPRLAATLPRFPIIGPGDRIAVSGQVRAPPEGGYGDYLRRTAVAGTLRAHTLERLASDSGPRGALEGLRGAAGDALTRTLPEPQAGLAAGILVGLRERVDRELAAAFTTAGVSHVVAISGWNIAIVAGVVEAVARRRGRGTRIGLVAIAIAAYTVLSGASPSVVRAATMAGVVLLATVAGRPGGAAAALGWAVAVLLVIDPRLIDDVGLQLSAAATAGLIAWGRPLAARIDRWAGGRLPGFVTEGLGVSLAAQLATLPIIVFAFGRLAVVATAVNLVVVPLVPPAMAAGAVALVAGAAAGAGLPEPLAIAAAIPAWALLGAMVLAVHAGAAVPFATLELEPPASLVVAALAGVVVVVAGHARLRRELRRWLRAAGLLGAAALPSKRGLQAGAPSGGRASGTPGAGPKTGGAGRGRRLERAVASLAALAIVVAATAVLRASDGQARLVVLDVGQGDAVLVEGPTGGRLLVDGGPDPDRLIIELDRRLPPWDRRIDLVVLTHPHEDHVAGLALLLDRFAVARVAEPGMAGPGNGYVAWEERLGAGGPARVRLATGDLVTFDGIDLEVLWPDAGSVPAEPADTGTGINNVSIVLAGSFAGRRFLLTGDIEEEIDPTLLARGLPTVDVLKLAHHGSRTSSTEPFLAAVRPAVAVASAGARNRYGHPTPETIERAEATGARVLRTDRDGSVEVRLGPGGVRVSTSGPRSATTSKDPGLRVSSLGSSPGGPPREGAAAVTDVAAAGATDVATAATDVGPAAPAVAGVAYACGIPTTGGAWGLAPATPAAVSRMDGPRSLPRPSRGRLDLDAAGQARDRAADPGCGGWPMISLRYHRGDVDPRPRALTALAIPRPASAARPALARRGRGRRLAGGTRGPPWRSGEPRPHVGRRMAPRWRLGPAATQPG